MPKRKAVDALPDDIRRQLDERLVTNGFRDYEALEQWLTDQGFSIGKSSIHRHGQELKSQHDEAMASARELLALTRASGELGESGTEISRHSAVILQTEVVRTSLAVRNETDPAKRAGLLAKLTKAQADIGRMVISAEKWKIEFEAKIREEERLKAADAATAAAKAGGATPELITTIRQALGIA